MRYDFNVELVDVDPTQLVAVVMYDNNNPLQERYSEETYSVLPFYAYNDGVLSFQWGVTGSISIPYSVGAIMSLDRETIYWVNETKPIPAG